MKRSKKTNRRVTGSGQLSLIPETRPAKRVTVVGDVRFCDPDPSLILVNNTPLESLLKSMEQEFILQLRELMRSLDWSAFENKYQGGGRVPFRPALMMSLILFGAINGHRSLRTLEQFSATDIRCWWLSGGETPDHTTFAKFFTRHQTHISNEFFESLTAEILTQLNSSARSIAIDGTVMQAAGSRLRTLSAEAAKLEAERAQKEVNDSDDDPQVKTKAEKAEKVSQVATKVAEGQRNRGRVNQSGRVCRTEPEAPIRQLKSGGVAPSYVASIAATDERIITGHAVDSTSETHVVEAMVEQSERCSDQKVEQMLADAGYVGHTVLDLAVNHDIDLLCPEGKARGEDDWTKKSGKKLSKSSFIYDEETNTYRCPGDEVLHHRWVVNTSDGQLAHVYQARTCSDCHLKSRCTTAKNRRVKRYESDAMKEALRQVMSDPRARHRYRRRQTMVEPVFAELRHIQNLNRFGRRGLLGAKMEWALHCAAHNLRRYQARVWASLALIKAFLAAMTASQKLRRGIGDWRRIGDSIGHHKTFALTRRWGPC